MPPLKPGFYVYCAPCATDRVAVDLFGPFDTRDDVLGWLAEHKIEYRENGEAFERAVLTWSEMTDGESDGAWATAIHRA